MSFQINTSLLQELNPEYAKALARGEPWALKHAGQCESINRGEPEGARRQFDGKPRKWCGGSCPNKKGCITCALPENHDVARLNREYKSNTWED